MESSESRGFFQFSEALPLTSVSSGFRRLPAELRLKIWSCAVEPRIVILHDLVHQEKSYPIPPVTQLNHEARSETREGYEPIGQGSHFNFSRDILVCDPNISDLSPDKPLEDLAPRIQRLVFWDCFPDDGQVDGATPLLTIPGSMVSAKRLWESRIR